MEAATAWVKGHLVEAEAFGLQEDDDALADAVRFGFDGEAMDTLKALLNAPQEAFAVWPENVPAVDAFLTVATQWMTALVPGEGGLVLRYVGLNYTGAKVALDAMEIAITPPLWNGLAIMEGAALAALNGRN
jgi:hypothetical protein